MKEYANVFTPDSPELGVTDLVQHVIDTGDYPPIHQPAWKIPWFLQEKLKLRSLLEQGIVVSSWASPVVPVVFCRLQSP